MSRAVTGAALAVAALVLTGCSASNAATAPTAESAEGASASASTVAIETNLGDVEVPVLPERVAVLDNTAFETVRDLGIEPVALPMRLVPERGFETWHEDADIVDVGTHREPDLEALAAAEPDLIIGGYRFAEYQNDLEAIAPTIDIAGSDEAEDGWLASLERQTLSLGTIFDADDEAQAIVDDLRAAEQEAIDAAPESTVFLGVVSAGQIDNGASRLSRIVEHLPLRDVFAGQEGDIHGDSGLAPETIAQANPDWAIVLDRDAGIGETDAQPALAVLEGNEALANTDFITEEHVIVLEPDFYRLEGAQSYARTFRQLAEAFAAA